MNAQRTLKISILGKTYTVVTDELDIDVYAAAGVVDNLFQTKGMKSLPTHGQLTDKIAVIVALQIATELIKTRKALNKYEATCDGLTDLIEQSL